MKFENVEVVISTKWGDIRLPFNDWLKSDVDEAFQRSPSRILDSKTGEELPYIYIPMPYRQNLSSRFYVDTGVCEPPWQLTRNEWMLDQIQEATNFVTINDTILHKIQIGKFSLGFPLQLFSFQDQIGLHIDEAYLSDIPLAPKNLPISLSYLWNSSSTVAFLRIFRQKIIKTDAETAYKPESYWINYLETMLPDPNLGIEMERQYNEVDSGYKCYAIHKLEKHDLMVLTALIKTPDIEEVLDIEQVGRSDIESVKDALDIEAKPLNIVYQTEIPFIALTKGSDRVEYLRSIIQSLEIYTEE